MEQSKIIDTLETYQWSRRRGLQATVIEQWRRKDMIMMAPVTKCRCKKETVMTALVTEQSLARYIIS